MFDGDNIYVAARLYDNAPPEKWIANELRRDTNQMRQNDHFGVGFDTFYDRRSGFMFYANLLGGFADYSVVDEGCRIPTGTRCGTSKTGRFDGGWTVEMAVPVQVAALHVRAPTRCGASSSAARSGTRTSGPTGRRCRSTWRAPQALNRVSACRHAGRPRRCRRRAAISRSSRTRSARCRPTG